MSTQSKPTAGATTPEGVHQALMEAFRKFSDLHSARPLLSAGGMQYFNRANELGMLAARILNDLGVPLDPSYALCDLYGHDGLPTSDEVGLEKSGAPRTPADYQRLDVHIAGRMERIARDWQAIDALQKLRQENIDLGVRTVAVLRSICKHSPG